MIERKFINENMQQYKIKEFISNQLKRAGLSDVDFKKTPLGEKIIIYAHRPGLVVGRGGSNIAKLTKKLKKNFDFENPQVEIEEVENPYLDPNIVAEMIANSLERFGPTRFKGIGYRSLNDVMDSGARGVEILITGRVPSARARKWRFYSGYLKKCGETAKTGVKSGFNLAVIRAGSVGIKVKIMPPDARLPDDVEIYSPGHEEITDEKTKEEVKELDEKKEKKKDEDSEEKEESKSDSKEEEPAEDSEAGDKEKDESESKDSKTSQKSQSKSKDSNEESEDKE